MRCTSCNKRIDAPIQFCPKCGAEIPEENNEQLRNEIRMQEAKDDETRRKWKIYAILATVEIVVGAILCMVVLYFAFAYNLKWLLPLAIVLWVFGFVFLGFIKGGFRCPFCGGLLGNIAGDRCAHCSKKFR